MKGEVGDRPMRNQPVLTEVTRDSPRAARHGDRPEDRAGAHPRADRGSLWAIADVSAYLQVPVSSIYKMTARKAVVRIPHIRIGGKLRFRPSDIDRWLTAAGLAPGARSRAHQDFLAFRGIPNPIQQVSDRLPRQ